MWRCRFIAVFGAAGLLGAAGPAVAQQASGLPATSGALLGDIGGLRTVLAAHGVTLGVQETSELFANARGGKTPETAYDGETEAVLQMDTDVAFGLPGGMIDASAIQVHGRNLSTDTLEVWQTLTSIEADRSLRLWELWYQQALPGGIDLRVGQQSIDQEFMVNANAAVLINSAFGWPLLPSLDLPGGGPSYPLSELGARLHVAFDRRFALLAGVYNGSPLPEGCTADPQRCDASGTSFPLNGGQMAIAELQLTVPGKAAGTYKIGAWFDTRWFADRRVATDGLPLANPLSTGVPRHDRGNWSVYGLLDQTLWRAAHGLASLGVFARAEAAPGDRNLIAISAAGGLLARAPLPGRDQDSASFGIGYGGTGNAPRRGGETMLEATYLAQLRPWLQLQPDAQYFFNPAGGIADPAAPTRRLRNALVLGSRLTAIF